MNQDIQVVLRNFGNLLILLNAVYIGGAAVDYRSHKVIISVVSLNQLILIGLLTCLYRHPPQTLLVFTLVLLAAAGIGWTAEKRSRARIEKGIDLTNGDNQRPH